MIIKKNIQYLLLSSIYLTSIFIFPAYGMDTEELPPEIQNLEQTEKEIKEKAIEQASKKEFIESFKAERIEISELINKAIIEECEQAKKHDIQPELRKYINIHLKNECVERSCSNQEDKEAVIKEVATEILWKYVQEKVNNNIYKDFSDSESSDEESNVLDESD